MRATLLKSCGWASILVLLCLSVSIAAPRETLNQGDTVTIQGAKGVVKLLQALPYVDSSYSSRMIWQKYDDPRLAALRKDLRLDNALLKGKTEFERQLLLMDFVNSLWRYEDPKDLKKTFSPAKIVEENKQEHRFYCEQYACVLSGTAASVGWVCRLVSHWGHTWCEMWSNQYGKWVYMDPTANRWVAGEDGVPLSAAEVRLKSFTSGGSFPARYGPSGGQRNWSGDRRFAVIGFHPNTDLLDRPFDYDKMYVIVDQHSGSRKDVRGKGEPVKDPLVDPYFPINQASLLLERADDGIAVTAKTLTPNFKTFRARVDGGKWRNCGDKFTWRLHGGSNVLEVKSVNQFEVDGPLSKVEVVMDGPAGAKPSDDDLGPVAPEEEGKVAGMGGLAAVKVAGELEPVPFEEKLKDEWLSMWCKPGQWVEWDLAAPAAGEFTVTVFYRTSYYPRRELRVNGKAVPGLESFVLPSTGGWRDWKKAALPVKVKLSKGANTFRLTSMDDAYVWLRQVVLSGQGQEITLGAFDFAREGGGTIQKTFVPRNGSFYGWDDKGHWLEWQAHAPAAGRYQVYLRVAGLNRALRGMKTNGQPIENQRRTEIEPTGGWQVWTEIPFGEAQLKAGTNTIRMENLNGQSMNLNAIRFVSPTAGEILVNAVDFVAQGGGEVKLRK